MGGHRDFDWRRLAASDEALASGEDSRGRLRWVLAMFAACAAIVMARVAALEIFYGEAYRTEAARPIRRVESIPGARGRILARDGTVLACDRQLAALAVEYRYLQQPPDARWLELQTRRRLPPSERRDRAKVDAERQRFLAEREAVRRRLALLCGRTTEEFRARAAEIQSRVAGIAAAVNERRRRLHDRRQAKPAQARLGNSSESAGRLARAARWLASLVVVPQDEAAYAPIAVAEELDDHVVFEDVPLEAVAEIAAHPERYPGVRIVERRRRIYPSGSLAAHVLGHLGPDGAGGWAGQMGAERQFESLLAGRDGQLVELTNRSGQVLSTEREREPHAGRDLILSIDPGLQRTAETLLDQALARGVRQAGGESGGAIVVLDIATGAVLASASAPRFDPGVFASRDQAELPRLLNHPGRPLFDRASRMAIPPGSTFKALSAVALLESGATTPEETFYCQGYLHQPTRQRCLVYRRHGRGHEHVTLSAALAQSCNVYFFHFAEQAGAEPLVAWAEAFGFGAATGIDLPDESPGRLPRPAASRAEQGHAWREGDTLSMAIGQGGLTATPLQIARLFAAIGSGKLVTPRLALRIGRADDDALNAGFEDAAIDEHAPPRSHTSPRSIPGLRSETLAAIRRGLEQVVADGSGTAHRTVYLESISIAGKTGTAETGGGREDHAWFAGYVPAEAPIVAFAIALEHAGSGADAAGPIARRLVQKLDSLGYFRRAQSNKLSHKIESGEPAPSASASEPGANDLR